MTSEWDTPEIVQLRDRLARAADTSEIVTPERVALRRRIVEQLFSLGGIAVPLGENLPILKRERRVDVVLGLPASGKSSVLVRPLRVKHGSVLVDADEAKILLPEYEGGRMAGAVHQESSDIAEDLMVECIVEQLNMVIPLIGKNDERVLAICRDFTEAAYEVEYGLYVHLVELPLREASRRAVQRFQQDGRFVDPVYVETVGLVSPLRTYARIKAEVSINGFSHWSNDVPLNGKPILIDFSSDDAIP